MSEDRNICASSVRLLVPKVALTVLGERGSQHLRSRLSAALARGVALTVQGERGSQHCGGDALAVALAWRSPFAVSEDRNLSV